MADNDQTEDSHPGEDETFNSAAGLGAVGLDIGPYKLLSVLGEGGFGIVYLAEQKHPVRRRVALKVVKVGMDTRQVIARFEAERQALAMMDHPNIARVLDVGATEAGRPYFVMELVRGEPVTEYCDRHRLTIEQRLDVLIDVCQGVHHAHQKGVIHRDLKPTNVLVTVQDDRPVAKIIDFGVAKAMAQPLTERTLYTEQGQLIGTPEYMSPEQAEMSGLDIDTRSDVYSLGVLLYELISGVLPFDREELRRAGFGAIQQIIRNVDPPRPSTKLSSLGDELGRFAGKRGTEPGDLHRRLRGDLDWITMKAMEKDRTRRYATASALAGDLRRYLDNEPVEAGPPTVGYRLRKIVRKHRAPLAAAATIAALALATVVSTTLYLLRSDPSRDGRSQGQSAGREAQTRPHAKQEALAHSKPPRVDISYDVERYGRQRRIVLPFVIGVMADLSGDGNEPMGPVEKRIFRYTDISNLDDRIMEAQPRLAIRVPNKLTGKGDLDVVITFEGKSDFNPYAVATKVPVLKRLVDARNELLGKGLLDRDSTIRIGEIDRQLTEQLRLILHHEKFQRLEGTWRGLEHLVCGAAGAEMVKVGLMNISKAEIAEALSKSGERSRSQDPVYKRAHDDEYGRPGGEPFSVLIGDYYFDHSPEDVALLEAIAKTAAVVHAPFIAGASPGLFQMRSWQELPKRPPAERAKTMAGRDYAQWNALRESACSMYVALTAPRCLARSPYVMKPGSAHEVYFQEQHGDWHSSKYTWFNSAYAMGANIAIAFDRHGWCAQIQGPESGGKVDRLPAPPIRTKDERLDLMCPMEIPIRGSWEAHLTGNGLAPLCHWKNTNYAVFVKAQSLWKPGGHADRDANTTEIPSSELPLILTACRFVHYLMCIMRDKIGAFSSTGQMEKHLNGWLATYVDAEVGKKPDPRRPLRAARVRIIKPPGSDDCTATLMIQPHYQLPEMTAPMRLVFSLPAPRKRS